MAISEGLVSIPGSWKAPRTNARVISSAPSDERLEVTVRVRPKNPLPNMQNMLKLSSLPLPQLTHDQFVKCYGAKAEDLALVRRFAKENNLSIVRESPARHSIMLAGTVPDFNRAFRVSLKTYGDSRGTYRGRTGAIKIPAKLAPVIEGVFGLDNRPIARQNNFPTRVPVDGISAYTGTQLAKIYNFPKGFDGSGQTIGIIALGGGYLPSDLSTYFSALGLTPPIVIPVSVDGGINTPGGVYSDAAEVALDIQVAGSAAPGAKIVVYFAPNDAASNGFLDAVTKAIHDEENNPSVISISWGCVENNPTPGFQIQFNKALQAAALLGVTVCVAAGDNGAADVGPKSWDGKARVQFPSSSPFALSCGGTRVIASDSIIKTESVWNQHRADLSISSGPDGAFRSSGGGVSEIFRLPDYQKRSDVPLSSAPKRYKGRGVPDVVAHGDPEIGYSIMVQGQRIQKGGTSAVAPFWAALIAVINQKLNGRVGFVNPQLYALPANSGAFRDISIGNNRVSFQGFKDVGYDARAGWDPCAGLGSPDGTILSEFLKVGGTESGV